VRHPAALALAAAAALWVTPTAALAVATVPHEVVVKRAGDASHVLHVPDVSRALAGLRAQRGIRYAVPNVQAHAAGAFLPNDPGATTQPGGWAELQWNFAGPFGVGAPEAWGHAIDAGAPGGAGVTVAVLDTGVAYKDRKAFRRSPDLARRQFVPGHDFVDGDRYPFDTNGHGTHVTSTIAERTDNGFGLTGLAYGVRIMPVRVLDSTGSGDAADIAGGLRFAARHGAKVINLSLNFDVGVHAAQIPEVRSALGYAHRRGAVIVAAAGNEHAGTVAWPARDRRVLAVGATTENGCMASFSNHGAGVDLVAPGGGADAALGGDPGCVAGRAGRSIDQVTLVARRPDRFGIPTDFIGTSMATPHVSATAALVIADGAAGRNPSPEAVAARLEGTARDLGAPGYDTDYGWGLVDAAAATAR
jgi:serine protease